MADGSDYVKYVTQQFVQYIETPREQRKQTKQTAKAARGPWLTHWFGWGPMSIMLWWNGRKNVNHKKRQEH